MMKQKTAGQPGVKRNALYNIAYRVFSILLPLVTAPYLSRTVGQSGVGLYSYAWSVSYIFGLVGLMGLENYGVRTIAKVRENQDELNRTFSEIWLMQLMVAGLALLGYLGYVFLVAGAEKQIALHLTMMSVSCLCNLDWCLMGLDQFRSIALRNTAVKLLAAGCVFVFVHRVEDLWIYAFVWSLATLLGCISCSLSLRGHVHPVRVSLRSVMKHLPPCSLLFISVMAVNIYRTMDKVMVGSMSSMEQNGLYENAEKIIYCLSGFISAIGTVLLPRASNLFRKGKKDAVMHQIDGSMQLMLCMVCGMAFGIAAIAKRFAPLFYGEDFAASGELMIPLAFTLILIGFANVIRTQWILPQSRDSIFVRSVSCGAAVNLIVNALLIPKLGAAGAVVGTLLAEGAVPVVQALILRKELPYRSYLLYLGEYIAIGLVMLLVVHAMEACTAPTWGGLAVQIVIGGVVYGVLCFGLWIATRNRRILHMIPVIGKRF